MGLRSWRLDCFLERVLRLNGLPSLVGWAVDYKNSVHPVDRAPRLGLADDRKPCRIAERVQHQYAALHESAGAGQHTRLEQR